MSDAIGTPVVREFSTGANRDRAEGKLNYFGFISPKAQRRFGAYMNRNRVLADGSVREGDNWQRGIPIPVYIHSLFRHAQELHEALGEAFVQCGGLAGMDKLPVHDPLLLTADEIATALFFNVQGYLHERVKALDNAGVPYPGKRVHGKPPLSYPDSERLYLEYVSTLGEKIAA